MEWETVPSVTCSSRVYTPQMRLFIAARVPLLMACCLGLVLGSLTVGNFLIKAPTSVDPSGTSPKYSLMGILYIQVLASVGKKATKAESFFFHWFLSIIQLPVPHVLDHKLPPLPLLWRCPALNKLLVLKASLQQRRTPKGAMGSVQSTSSTSGWTISEWEEIDRWLP